MVIHFDLSTQHWLLSTRYLMTLFARASTLGSMFTPICFAVFQIDDEIKLPRRLDREIGGFVAFEDFVYVNGCTPRVVLHVVGVSQ